MKAGNSRTLFELKPSEKTPQGVVIWLTQALSLRW